LIIQTTAPLPLTPFFKAKTFFIFITFFTFFMQRNWQLDSNHST
jgi:hypothetical protein